MESRSPGSLVPEYSMFSLNEYGYEMTVSESVGMCVIVMHYIVVILHAYETYHLQFSLDANGLA
jgi:hypothetical protein